MVSWVSRRDRQLNQNLRLTDYPAKQWRPVKTSDTRLPLVRTRLGL